LCSGSLTNYKKIELGIFLPKKYGVSGMKKYFMIVVFMIPFFLTKGFSQTVDSVGGQYGPWEDEVEELYIPFDNIITYRASLGRGKSNSEVRSTFALTYINQIEKRFYISTNVNTVWDGLSITEHFGIYPIISEQIKVYGSFGVGLTGLEHLTYALEVGTSFKIGKYIFLDLSLSHLGKILSDEKFSSINYGFVVNSDFFK
jgi:hypothetical protein